MATDSAVKSVTNTLSGTTADTITLTALYPEITVTNHDAGDDIYFRQDGVVAVAAANNTTLVPAATSVTVPASQTSAGTIVISIVGNGNGYTIEGHNSAGEISDDSDSEVVGDYNIELPPGFAAGDNVDTQFLDMAEAVNAAVAADVLGGLTDGLGQLKVNIPAGQFLVTEPGAMLTTLPAAARARGVEFQGRGEFTTEIKFAPAAPGALIVNDDAWSRITFRDMSFIGGGTNATIMDTLSDNGPQDFLFERVHWRGTWADCFHLTGSNNNDSWQMFGCVWKGTFDNVFNCTNNEQALCFNLFGCNAELNAGNLFTLTKGGYVVCNGGSYILGVGSETATGIFFNLPNSGPAGGVPVLDVTGIRFEVRSSNVKLVNCTWHTGNVNFRGCNDIGYATNQFTTTVRVHFETQGGGPIVLWDGCRLGGKHEYETTGGTPDDYRRIAVYRGCIIQAHDDPADFISQPVAASRFGATWPVKFVDCRSGNTVTGGSATVFDCTLPAALVEGGVTEWRLASFKRGEGWLPNDQQTTTVVKLPLNAIVRSAMLYAEAGAFTQVNTTWAFTITDGDGLEIFKWEGATLGALNVGIKSEKAVIGNPFHVCSTTNKRTLTLTANANVDQATILSLCLVEFAA